MAVARFAPFCSLHCADVDLVRWFDGGYVVPGHEPAERAPNDDDNDNDDAA
ncbi:MAG: DNA gyrase inhibitor YacG [Alphaproteobacteria bacterium]|nr:DNA gyrase inhibitor YacG [Alphaproteobacteria bacterium]